MKQTKVKILSKVNLISIDNKIKYIKDKKGITLITLVITILALIILASVTISVLTGDNGIINMATKVKEESVFVSAEEELRNAVLSSYDFKSVSPEILIDELNKNVQKINGIEENTVITKLPTTVAINDVNYRIKENGDIEKTLLPKGYTELDYIEGTGTQYINTGFKPNPTTTRVETTFQVTNNTKINQRLFGTRISYSDGKTICSIFWHSQNKAKAFRVDWVGNASTVSSTFELNTDITMVCENNKVIINDLEEYTSTTKKSDSYLNYPIYINNFTNNGQFDANQPPAYAKWKMFKIYDDGTLVRDFIPCKNVEGKAGLYDLVENKFYSSETGTDFIAGNEI